MNKINFGDLMLVALFVLLSYLLYALYTYPTHPSQLDDVCCTITVEDRTLDTATITWVANTHDDSHTIFVEVEYIDEDYTLATQLQFEIEYAISEMQGLCQYHQHNH